jgi:hypothetical protein
MFYIDSDNKLAYLNSLNIKVFPSGRRKSELLNENSPSDKHHIPIDPEARLNTEANHRKHSGLNGYKQSYILDWNGKSISLVLAGYLFNIKLSEDYESHNSKECHQYISEYLAENLKDTSGNTVVTDSIFVNILTTDVTFFSSIDGTNDTNSQVSTEILRDQSFSSEPSTCLDLPKNGEPQNKAASYYFSGLSFSAEPLEDIKSELKSSSSMHAFSLQILKRSGSGEWHVYEPSKLPIIEHGETENSVKIPGDLHITGNLTVDGTITADEVIIDGRQAITLDVVKNSMTDKWQLQFHNANFMPPLE